MIVEMSGLGLSSEVLSCIHPTSSLLHLWGLLEEIDLT
jgi:hypothetical protein